MTSERVGRETVDYVGNIYKYYVAYKLVMATKQAQDQARKSIRRKKSPRRLTNHPLPIRDS